VYITELAIGSCLQHCQLPTATDQQQAIYNIQYTSNKTADHLSPAASGSGGASYTIDATVHISASAVASLSTICACAVARLLLNNSTPGATGVPAIVWKALAENKITSELLVQT
jgi:hypothetical protein